MAARNRLFHQESVREKIQSSQLINRLMDHAFGKIELEQSQIKSIEILLRKNLPDLAQLQLVGGDKDDNPIRVLALTDQEIIKRFEGGKN